MASATTVPAIPTNTISEAKIAKYLETDNETAKITNKTASNENKPQETPREDINDKINDDSDVGCRLNVLTTNCLIKCFEDLSLCDLLHVCDVDDYFQTIIIEHIIHKKFIDFTDSHCHWPLEQIFRVFGQKMRRIKIEQETRTNDLSYVFKLIINYCLAGNLTEIWLRFCHTIIDSDTLHRSIPFFTNVEKLVLLNYNNVNAYDDIMPIICSTTTKLEYLKLVGVCLSLGWADIKTVSNLKEFYLHERYTSCPYIALHRFLSVSRNLRTFSYIGQKDISDETIIELQDTFKNLERYNDFSIGGDFFTTPRYQCISMMPNIQHLSITSHLNSWNDIYEPLMELTQRNTLKSLNILINTDGECDSKPSMDKWCSALVQRNLCHLESFGVQIECDSLVECAKQKVYDCDFLAAFLAQFNGSLRNVTIHSKPYVCNAHQILDALPGLHRFSIVDMVITKISDEMDKLAKVLRNVGGGQQKLLRLFVNRHQYKELQVI